ncbi:hypothetical protein LXL04_027701 [Taraxacum kok-saghyz]
MNPQTVAGNNPHQQVPKLTGRNYHHCDIQMKVLFESLDLWDIIDEGYEELDEDDDITAAQTMEHKAKKKKDKKALFTIYQAVEDHIFERISNTKTSKEA